MKHATDKITEDSPEVTLIPPVASGPAVVTVTKQAPFRAVIRVAGSSVYLEPDAAEAVGAALLGAATRARVAAERAAEEEA